MHLNWNVIAPLLIAAIFGGAVYFLMMEERGPRPNQERAFQVPL